MDVQLKTKPRDLSKIPKEMRKELQAKYKAALSVLLRSVLTLFKIGLSRVRAIRMVRLNLTQRSMLPLELKKIERCDLTLS
jgi:hypothetical protein